MSEIKTEELYKSFLAGSMESFETLVIAYKDALIYFISRYVKDMATAEDLAQDTFVEILLHKERYNFKTAFKTYLFTIGRNKAVDHIRKQARIDLVEEYPDMMADEKLLEERIVKEEEKKELYEALHGLKEDYQKAIYLIDLEDMSYAQAAKVMGKSESQIKILIFRARAALRKEIEKHRQGNG